MFIIYSFLCVRLGLTLTSKPLKSLVYGKTVISMCVLCVLIDNPLTSIVE